MLPNFIKNNAIVYAPMAGITDSPARKLAKRFGADIVISGLISAEGVIRNSVKTWDLARFHNSERPIGLQIFGANPQSMAGAAAALSTLKPDFIDINFGCPARKIVGKNGGSSVLRDLKLLEKIVISVVKSIDIPVTVKMRAGWDTNELTFLEAGKIIEDCGVAALTFHPRTRMQGFAGKSDWKLISILKERISIPIIGNGDIFTPEDARRMLIETGCDAIMIGRGSLGNPMLFKRIKRLLEYNELIPEQSGVQCIDLALEHFEMMIEHFGLPHSVYKMRSQFCYYLRGLQGSAEIKTAVNRLQAPSEIRALLLDYRNSLERESSHAETRLSA
jgi:tRNA-dihydrouridine synthase B